MPTISYLSGLISARQALVVSRKQSSVTDVSTDTTRAESPDTTTAESPYIATIDRSTIVVIRCRNAMLDRSGGSRISIGLQHLRGNTGSEFRSLGAEFRFTRNSEISDETLKARLAENGVELIDEAKFYKLVSQAKNDKENIGNNSHSKAC